MADKAKAVEKAAKGARDQAAAQVKKLEDENKKLNAEAQKAAKGGGGGRPKSDSAAGGIGFTPEEWRSEKPEPLWWKGKQEANLEAYNRCIAQGREWLSPELVSKRYHERKAAEEQCEPIPGTAEAEKG